MSREIEFLAWNKVYKRMVVPLEIPLLQYVNNGDRYGQYVNCLIGSGLREVIRVLHSDLIFLQYTTLSDNAGIKIYEGNIVRLLTTSLKYPKVIRWANADACFCLGNIPLMQMEGSTLQVIGNIYEHANLLEQEL